MGAAGQPPRQDAPVAQGPRLPLNICLWVEDGVRDDAVTEFRSAITRELAPYGLSVGFPRVGTWDRDALTVASVIKEVAAPPLETGCDRRLALASRSVFETMYAAIFPEVGGATETITRTRAYAFLGYHINRFWDADGDSLAIHEVYHLLGCDHGLGSERCQAQVLALKERFAPSEMFPTLTEDEGILADRNRVNTKMIASLDQF